MRSVLWALSLALCTVESASAARRDPVFDGVWQGTLELVHHYGNGRVPWLPEGADGAVVRLELHGENVRINVDGVERIAPPGAFRITKHDAAALVYFPQSDHGYVGTWQLSLTKVDADTVLVFAWRVHNFAESEAVARADAYALLGELKRAPDNARRSD